MNDQQGQSQGNRAGEEGIHPPNMNITTPQTQGLLDLDPESLNFDLDSILVQGLLDLDPESLLNYDLDSILGPNSQVQGQNNVNFCGAEEPYNMNFGSPPAPNILFGAQLYNQQVHNLGEHSMNISFPPDPIVTHSQNQTQQSLSNQLFHVQPEVTDGSVNQPAEIRGSLTFRANDYKKSKKENKITCDTFENQGDIQREEIQHRTSGTTYVSPEIQGNIQSDDLEEEIQQAKISLDSIIQIGPVDTVIRSIVDFYAEKLQDSKVTYHIVEKCLTEYRKNEPKEPELFIEISKSIRHTKYYKTYYKNKNNDGKKCNWKKEATDNFELIIGKYESYTNKLKSNHGNIKTGFWEYVCFMLSKHGHDGYTPPQCAVKYKNCKAKK